MPGVRLRLGFVCDMCSHATWAQRKFQSTKLDSQDVPGRASKSALTTLILIIRLSITARYLFSTQGPRQRLGAPGGFDLMFWAIRFETKQLLFWGPGNLVFRVPPRRTLFSCFAQGAQLVRREYSVVGLLGVAEYSHRHTRIARRIVKPSGHKAYLINEEREYFCWASTPVLAFTCTWHPRGHGNNFHPQPAAECKAALILGPRLVHFHATNRASARQYCESRWRFHGCPKRRCDSAGFPCLRVRHRDFLLACVLA